MDVPPAQPRSIEPSTLAAELRVLLGRLRRRLREQASPGNLTPSQLAVLGRLEREGPATVTSLARREHVRPQSLGATVAGLEAAGLVSGAPDLSDRRQTIHGLTPAAREWIAVYRAAREDWLSRAIAASLSPEEQNELARAITLLDRVADAATDGATPSRSSKEAAWPSPGSTPTPP